METALYALYRAMGMRLTASPTESWGTRVYTGHVPEGVTRPYVVYSFAAGGSANNVRARDAEILIDVVCVANDKDMAMTGAARISELLDDQGIQDQPVSALDGGAQWSILTVTEEQGIDIDELLDGAQEVYHAGASYRVRLEKTG